MRGDHVDLAKEREELASFLQGEIEHDKLWDAFDSSGKGYLLHNEFKDLINACLGLFVYVKMEENESFISEREVPSPDQLQPEVDRMFNRLTPIMEVNNDGKIYPEQFRQLGETIRKEYAHLETLDVTDSSLKRIATGRDREMRRTLSPYQDPEADNFFSTSLKSAYEEDDLEAEEDLADKIAALIKDYSHFFVSENDARQELANFLTGSLDHERLWNIFDADKSGYLDHDEFVSLLKECIRMFFLARVDPNDPLRDELIPPDYRLLNAAEVLFTELLPQMDDNNDGVIEHEEFYKVGDYILEEYMKMQDRSKYRNSKQVQKARTITTYEQKSKSRTSSYSEVSYSKLGENSNSRNSKKKYGKHMRRRSSALQLHNRVPSYNMQRAQREMEQQALRVNTLRSLGSKSIRSLDSIRSLTGSDKKFDKLDRNVSNPGLANMANSLFHDVEEVILDRHRKKKGHIEYFGDQIMEYDTTGLTSFSFFTYFVGTVLASPSLWIKLLFLHVIAAIAGTISHFLINEDKIELGELRDFTVGFEAVLAFFAGFYIDNVSARWWTIRSEGIGGVCKVVTDLSLVISGVSVAPKYMMDEMRNVVTRYGLLAHSMIYLQAQEMLTKKHQEDAFKKLETKGLITKPEIEILMKVNRKFAAVWGWLLSYLEGLVLEEILPDDRFEQMAELCREGRAAAGLVLLHIDCQLPLPYVHLVCLMTNVYQFLFAVITGIVFSAGFYKDEIQVVIEQCLQFYLFCIVYQGILETVEKMTNPLGTDDIDFPQMYIRMNTQNECNSLFETSWRKPWEKQRTSSKI